MRTCGSIRDVTQQKLAEEMRDQFVDTATHELRTPLANIKAYAETLALADVIDVEQQKQFLNTINSEATRLARFVDDLLSVSSMELGSLSLNKQVTDLRRMLNEVLAKIRPQIEEKQLTFEVALPEKMPEPELDKDKIATVLVNLLGNAVKYTPAGGRVTFRVNITDQQIEISVEDTGVGIAADELPKVFDKFFRSQRPARAGTNGHRPGPGAGAGSRAAARRPNHGGKRNQQGQHVLPCCCRWRRSVRASCRRRECRTYSALPHLAPQPTYVRTKVPRRGRRDQRRRPDFRRARGGAGDACSRRGSSAGSRRSCSICRASR